MKPILLLLELERSVTFSNDFRIILLIPLLSVTFFPTWLYCRLLHFSIQPLSLLVFGTRNYKTSVLWKLYSKLATSFVLMTHTLVVDPPRCSDTIVRCGTTDTCTIRDECDELQMQTSKYVVTVYINKNRAHTQTDSPQHTHTLTHVHTHTCGRARARAHTHTPCTERERERERECTVWRKFVW